MKLQIILSEAAQKKVSDIFLIPGAKISAKIGGEVTALFEEKVMSEDCAQLLHEIYTLDNNRNMEKLLASGDDDFSFSVKGVGRFRCNAYKQRNSLAAVLRVVSFELPDPEKYNIPQQIIQLAHLKNGIVLVTGPAGCGKSTTLACVVDAINKERHDHIITIEDPIEYIHTHQKSVVSQREINHDTQNYTSALRAALRQSPNVILLGEMRDFETIQTALTAAETGQLVLSSLHTIGAAKTIDRIIDVFSPTAQQQIRLQLSMVLQAVVSQQLIPAIGGGVVPAFEIMMVNNAISNMIREGKVHQIDNVIYSGAAQGMCTMDADILRLYQSGKITKENAILYSTDPDSMYKKIGGSL